MVENFHNAGSPTWTFRTGATTRASPSGSTARAAALFVDLIESQPGSTHDDAERWTATFTDDFTGWKQLRFPFANLTRKEIGNGAPNDGLSLTEVHGWAFGALGTGGPRRYYLDQVTLFGAAGVKPLTLAFTSGSYGVTEGFPASIAVKLSRALTNDDPDQVTVAYALVPGTATPDRDYVPGDRTLTFSKGGPTQLSFNVPTIDNTKHDGTRTVLLRLADPAGASWLLHAGRAVHRRRRSPRPEPARRLRGPARPVR